MALLGSTNKGEGTGCLALFGLLFAAVGIVVVWHTLSMLATWHATQSWEEVPARITEAELDVRSDSDSTTYRAKAHYTYTYAGREHTGTRVAISGGADNIGSFHQDAHEELSRYEHSGEAFRCFVNPDDPSEAILYRDLRWEQLLLLCAFAVSFGGVGFGLIGWLSYTARVKRAEQHRREGHPGQPWRWKETWATGIIESSNKTLMVSVLFFALLWNAIALPSSVLVISEAVLGEGKTMALIALIFPAMGILMAVWAAYLIMRWRKYGRTVFRMAEVPGVIGGKLSGVIEVPTALEPADGFHLTLSSINRHTTGSGKNRHTVEKVLWQDTRIVRRPVSEGALAGTVIPVAFAIPYDSRETDSSDSSSQIIWRLEAKADVPGVDFQAQFDVPVFKTDASSPDFVLDESALEPFVEKREPLKELTTSGVRVAPLTGGGIRFECPMARQVKPALFLTVFLGLWAGAVVVMLMGDVPSFFPMVFGLFGLLLLYFTLDLWFGASHVEARFQELTFRGGLFGSGKTHRLTFGEIEEIKPVGGMQVGAKLYYTVAVKTTGGTTHTVANRLDGLKPAETIANALLNALRGTDR